MIKLVLLDRDGILNKELGDYVTCVEEFEVLPHAPYNLKRLQMEGIKLVVVTNQSGIAKQRYSHDGLAQIHTVLADELAKAGVQLDEIYYCPHHPSISNCLCRKPESGMIEKALSRFNVSPEHAVMIGDKPRDTAAAEGAGVKAFEVPSNHNWDMVVDEILGLAKK